MTEDTPITDSHALRERLMAPDPMQRAIGLHALEVEVQRCSTSASHSLAHEASRFAARGIPYYALNDRHFREWVGKAVGYWEKLHAGGGQRAVAGSRG